MEMWGDEKFEDLWQLSLIEGQKNKKRILHKFENMLTDLKKSPKRYHKTKKIRPG